MPKYAARLFFRRKQPENTITAGKADFMFKEITENTISKAKEDIVISQGLLALIAAVSFLTGLIIGILCASGSKSEKRRCRRRRGNFDADEYVRELNFDDDDDDGYEYSF
ncbi:MAG: hypothetical protein NC085_12740 [Muribaculaceae bacterium]|nr:hypothetical protein [Muribaculaceae bacterium]